MAGGIFFLMNKLQKLVDSGLTFELVGDAETGFSVALADLGKENAWVWDGTYPTLDLAEHELWRAARECYPKLKCFRDVRHISIYNN